MELELLVREFETARDVEASKRADYRRVQLEVLQPYLEFLEGLAAHNLVTPRGVIFVNDQALLAFDLPTAQQLHISLECGMSGYVPPCPVLLTSASGRLLGKVSGKFGQGLNSSFTEFARLIGTRMGQQGALPDGEIKQLAA